MTNSEKWNKQNDQEPKPRVAMVKLPISTYKSDKQKAIMRIENMKDQQRFNGTMINSRKQIVLSFQRTETTR